MNSKVKEIFKNIQDLFEDIKVKFDEQITEIKNNIEINDIEEQNKQTNLETSQSHEENKKLNLSENTNNNIRKPSKDVVKFDDNVSYRSNDDEQVKYSKRVSISEIQLLEKCNFITKPNLTKRYKSANIIDVSATSGNEKDSKITNSINNSKYSSKYSKISNKNEEPEDNESDVSKMTQTEQTKIPVSQEQEIKETVVESINKIKLNYITDKLRYKIRNQLQKTNINDEAMLDRKTVGTEFTLTPNDFSNSLTYTTYSNQYSKNADEDQLNITNMIGKVKLEDLKFELQNHPDIGIIINQEGNIIHQNKQFSEKLKFSQNECLQVNIKSIIHFEDQDKFLKELENFIQERDQNINELNKNYLNYNFQTEPFQIKISNKNNTQNNYQLSFEHSFNIDSIIMNDGNVKLIKVRLLSIVDEYKQQVINPRSSYQLSWTIILMATLIQIIWTSTFELAFSSKLYSGGNNQLNFFNMIFITSIFTFDLIQNFFVGYELNVDVIEFDHSKVIWNQFTGFFWFDLFSTIPFEQFITVPLNTQNLKLIKIVKLIKLLRLAKVQSFTNMNSLMKNEQFSEIAMFIKTHIGIFELLKVLFFLIFSTHFQTCLQFWYKNEIVEKQDPQWTFKQFLQDSQDKDAYEIQFKLQCEVLKTSLGLNSVTADDTFEILLDTLWIMFGLTIFGQGIGNISAYLTQSNKKDHEMNQTLKQFRELQEDHNCEQLSTLIETDVRDYQDNYNINEFSKLSQMLSKNIKNQLETAIYSDFIESIDIFSRLSIKTVRKLKQCKVKNNTYILRCNEVMHSVYFVLTGNIKIMNSNLCMLNEYKKGEIFGMHHFTEQQFRKQKNDISKYMDVGKDGITDHLLPPEESTSKKKRNLTDLIKKSIVKKIYEPNEFDMIYYDIDVQCNYQAVCETEDTTYLEVNQDVCEDILKMDIESFKTIQNHSIIGFEVINSEEQDDSSEAYKKFEENHLIGIMIKPDGFIYDINFETSKYVSLLNNDQQSKSIYDILKKPNNDKIIFLDDLVNEKQDFVINETKQPVQFNDSQNVKIARTDVDNNPFQKLKKSLLDIKILQFNHPKDLNY